MVNLGYACINETLRTKNKLTCSRGMIKRTFLARGLPRASNLALENATALNTVVRWNTEHDIHVFRITSCLFPWMSEYELHELPDYQAIKALLASAGKYALSHGQRLSFHPGQFCVLASPNPAVVEKTIKELNQTSEIMDMLGMPASPRAKINIHVGGAYGEHDRALARFCENFKRLDPNTQARLTVENDDKANLYSTKMLYEGVHKRIGIPIVFDSHHHELGPQDLDYHDAFHLARSTWPDGIRQQCHHSNSRREYEDPTAPPMAHSSWFYTPFEAYGLPTDVVLECKGKELALFKYREQFMNSKAA